MTIHQFPPAAKAPVSSKKRTGEGWTIQQLAWRIVVLASAPYLVGLLGGLAWFLIWKGQHG